MSASIEARSAPLPYPTHRLPVAIGELPGRAAVPGPPVRVGTFMSSRGANPALQDRGRPTPGLQDPVNDAYAPLQGMAR